MSTAGPNFAGTGADDASVGTKAWSNASRIVAEDGSSSGSALGAGTTHYLKATNFGFSIPSGATINGIQVEWKRSRTAGGTSYVDSAIRIVKSDGSIGSTNRSAGASWTPTTLTWDSFGSSSDLWGESWAYSDINSSNFGAVVSAIGVGSLTAGSVDACRITITYTASASGPANVKTQIGVAEASVKTSRGVAIASVKTVLGVA